MRSFARRTILKGVGALAAAGLARVGRAAPREILDDASGLNPTPVYRHWRTSESREAEFLARLRVELREAAAERRAFCVGAARHSMGGQAIARDGTAATFDVDSVEIDRVAKTFRAHAGTRWHQVIAHLDREGFSPAVMQSNSDFGIGSTFCVNAHGWPTPFGPFGATVRRFRMMLASGDVVVCSPTENTELFGLSMGGYGLTGVLLDLDVDMVENRAMRPKFERMVPGDFAARFAAAARDPAVGMIYGRLSVARAAMFEDALLVTYRPESPPSGGLPRATRDGGTLTGLARELYRAQTEFEVAKRARWFAESIVAPALTDGVATRNSLMNEPVSNLAGRDGTRTDILHEYFVAPEQFAAFVNGCRALIPKAQAEFLNVTLRHVLRDPTSALAYAKTDRIAAVMSFSQRRDRAGEIDMMRLTESMIDMVSDLGGSFYLPYRLHARPDQLRAVYPGIDRFLAGKRFFDPGLLFRNTMWDTYFASM